MNNLIHGLRNKYRHLIMPLALVGGFIADIFTLNQIDQVFDNAILILHIIIVATTIALLFSQDTEFGQRFLQEKRVNFLKTLMVFSFGALFSGFVIFYTRSGSIIISWPFLIAMVVLMLGSEFRKKYFHKLVLQIVIFYLALLAWANFFIPVITKKMGTWVFITSTIISTLLIFLFISLLKKINKKKIALYKRPLIIRIVGMLMLFHLLYFTNIIPPVPLSLKFKAVYYDIERSGSNYLGQYEKSSWINIFNKRNRSMHWREGEDIYVFTQVFAPTDLGTDINHVWEWYDEDERRWINTDTITLKITGGRSAGYRGFSKKSNLSYHRWRVKTSTARGQALGIISFNVEPYSERLNDLIIEEL